MDRIHPTIKSITANGWAGDPIVSNEPQIRRCCLEIGEAGEEAVDYFTLAIVNRPWARANGVAEPRELGSPAWLQRRAMLLSDAPSFEDVISSISQELASLGPYSTWPEFAKRMAHCMRWGLEGVPYPPFSGET